MEITGINEAAQLINVSINGIETTLKLSGSFLNWSLNQVKSIAKLIAAQVHKKSEELAPGEMLFGDMLKKMSKNGMKPALYNIDDDIMPEVTQKLRDMGVPFSIFPDVNLSDGKGQIMVPDSYNGSMLALSNSFNIYDGPDRHIAISRTSLQEYVSNGDPNLIDDLVKRTLDDEQQKELNNYLELGYENTPDSLENWGDRYGEILVLNNLNPDLSSDIENDVRKYFSDKQISAVKLPNDSNGRTCFLFDSSRSAEVRELFNDGVIPVTSYMQNINDKDSLSDWFRNKTNNSVLENLQQKGISPKVFEDTDDEWIEDVVIPADKLEGRFIDSNKYSVRLKLLDGYTPANECYADIPKNRLSKDKDGNYHIKLLSKEKIYLSYDPNISSKIIDKKDVAVISGRNVNQFNKNFLKAPKNTIKLDKDIDIKPITATR